MHVSVKSHFGPERMNFFFSGCKSFQYHSSSRSLWKESCVVKWNEHEKNVLITIIGRDT